MPQNRVSDTIMHVTLNIINNVLIKENLPFVSPYDTWRLSALTNVLA
jgi:hypothetical protein